MEDISILLFYKFVEIRDPEAFKKEHLEFCEDLGILGKVLVAEEGINGSVSGTKEQTDKYKEVLREDPRFTDIEFKEEFGKEHPFTKMSIKVKKEIIRLDKEVDMSKTGDYLEPQEFLDLCESGEEFILLDTRNDYESKVGKFKGAITPDIKTFREFPEYVEKIKDKKDKKIVIYCTGGIRCEKASAYMKEQGFEDVKQIHGGIITYDQTLPNTLWEGKCFVFDKRLLSGMESNKDSLQNCVHCDKVSDLYRNCKSEGCNRLTIMCKDCEKEMNGCCSSKCLEDFRKQCRIKSLLKQKTYAPEKAPI